MLLKHTLGSRHHLQTGPWGKALLKEVNYQVRVTWPLLLSLFLFSASSPQKKKWKDSSVRKSALIMSVWVPTKGKCMSLLLNIEYCFSGEHSNSKGWCTSIQAEPTHYMYPNYFSPKTPQTVACCSKPAIQSNFTHSLCAFYLPSDSSLWQNKIQQPETSTCSNFTVD